MTQLTRNQVEQIVKNAQNKNTSPDLSGMDLSRVDLNRMNLSGANLSGANLTRTNLEESDLRWANLREVNFRQANLTGANLSEADLSGANLKWANLHRAHLNEADLNKVDLTEAVVAYTTFADVDLSTVRGLDTVEHYGPSNIDTHTLSRSRGKIPEAFLRGAGVPDTFISYATSLTNQPIRYYSCFISYSHKDEAFAQRLYADLQSNAIRCWYAPKDLKIGDKLRSTIDQSIRLHDKLLLVLSQHSVNSSWVEAEVETMLEQEQERGETALFPIRLDDAVMEIKVGWAAQIRRSRLIGDFTRWREYDAYQKAFRRLVRDLRA